MISMYPFFSINKLSFTGLNVIIYSQSIAAVSPLVGGGGRGGRGRWRRVQGVLQSAFAHFTLLLGFLCYFSPSSPTVLLVLCWQVPGGGLWLGLLRQKLQLFVVATFTAPTLLYNWWGVLNTFFAPFFQISENAELTSICDELINKMGGQRS